MRRCLLLLAALLLLPLAARPAAPPQPSYEKWTIDDVVNQESLSDVQFSPDGKFAVWVKSAPDKDKNEHVGHIFRADLVRQREVQLTRGPDSCTSPRWSPDGHHIAFLSSRPLPKSKEDKGKSDEEGQKTQIWLLDTSGGEPWPLTELSRDVDHFAWAGSDAILYCAK